MNILFKIMLLAVLVRACTTEKQQPEKPNVLFILADDLGVNDLGATGSSYYETPHLDRLAAKSMVFTQGYAGSRVCSPSRATIMTGKFTARHGITDWIGAKSGTEWRELNRHDKLLPAAYRHHLSPDEVTLAASLKAHGYRTFFAGKWHLGDEGHLPEDHGFDLNKGGWDKGSPAGGYFSPFKNLKLSDGSDGEQLSMRLAEETVQFMREQQAGPFFAFLSFYAVHSPIQTTQEQWGKFQRKASEQGIAETGFQMERKLPIRQRQDNPVYAGLLESMDEAIGRVLDELQRLGLSDNTIVIFTSDNGGVASGDAYATANLPYRGGKGYQWEGGLRVPCFISLPGQKLGSQQSDYPMTGADFYPTILDLAGIPLLDAQHIDGLSLKPILTNGAPLPERPLYWHYPHYGNQGGDPSSVIRQGKWKLTYYYEGERAELYNLQQDPFEQHNLAEEEPGTAQALSAKLMQWLAGLGAAYPEPDPLFDAAKRAAYDSAIVNQRLPKLEAQRREMLSPDFEPNPDWWGSKLTQD